MAESRIAVYAQLPGDFHKTLAGQLVWNPDTAVGAFSYDEDWRSRKNSYFLDPTVLIARPRKETRNEGVYGVIRDAGPDAWGRDQLIRQHGALDEIGILQHAPEDGAGNLSFHAEHRLRAYTLQEIDAVSAGFPLADTALAQAIQPGTSMGGAKPKLLAYDAGAFWIAKFPEKGDPECKGAANEHAMLQLAARCGIRACESRLHRLPDGRLVILVKRFDLSGTPERHTRLGFASAHTVLGMGDPRRDGQLKSYPLLRFEARRWTRAEIGPELWQRLAFNALVSNMDDHARNHALIHEAGWALSPAFDIVAAPATGPVRLCLQIHTGSVIATPASLITSASEMGVERDLAIATLREMSSLILEQWRTHIGEEMSGAAIDQLVPAFRLAEEVRAFDFAGLPPPVKARRYRNQG
ncbi:type II toxin-antitoxin system HipA family toxin [Ferriphaselus sp. R-1]|uniref:type II toxin-antitoxin system HipA family toxin n=1 Tax=Ferriphaselus sp. R-1 TaxID=1485544 RepID=UPI00069057AF|nr:type II toxin-antitoxin system HipA family toxin [Ferriphaselus sp. R-1]